MNENGRIRTLPTTMVTGYWDKGSASEIPDEIKIVLADGTKARYRIIVEQPHPQCIKAMELIRSLDRRCGYVGKHTKK